MPSLAHTVRQLLGSTHSYCDSMTNSKPWLDRVVSACAAFKFLQPLCARLNIYCACLAWLQNKLSLRHIKESFGCTLSSDLLCASMSTQATPTTLHKQAFTPAASKLQSLALPDPAFPFPAAPTPAVPAAGHSKQTLLILLLLALLLLSSRHPVHLAAAQAMPQYPTLNPDHPQNHPQALLLVPQLKPLLSQVTCHNTPM